MSLNTVTVTGKVGPGLTETSQVYNNVTALAFDYNAGTVSITVAGKISRLDLSGITTVTYTISGGNATVVIS